MFKSEYRTWIEEIETGPARFPVIKFTLAIMIGVAAVAAVLALHR